jgi:hypothetical protein
VYEKELYAATEKGEDFSKVRVAGDSGAVSSVLQDSGCKSNNSSNADEIDHRNRDAADPDNSARLSSVSDSSEATGRDKDEASSRSADVYEAADCLGAESLAAPNPSSTLRKPTSPMHAAVVSAESPFGFSISELSAMGKLGKTCLG